MRMVRYLLVTTVVALFVFALWLPAARTQDESDLKGAAGDFDGTVMKVFPTDRVVQCRVTRFDDTMWKKTKRVFGGKKPIEGHAEYVRGGAVLGIDRGDYPKLVEGMKVRIRFRGYREDVLAPRPLRDAGGPEHIDVWEADEVVVLEPTANRP